MKEDIQTKAKLCVVTTIAGVVIVAVWGILLNVILLYNLPESFDSLTNVNQESNCTQEVYNGEVCRTVLQNYQGCLTSDYTSSEIYIPADRDQEQLEQRVNLLVTGLQSINPSQECAEVAIPFLCFYLFGLCDSSGQVRLPSSQQCETISSETCASETETVMGVFSSFLQCESLPINSIECVLNGSSIAPETTEGNSTSDEINCQVDFFLDNRTCVPKCGEWGIVAKEVTTAFKALETTASIIGIIGGMIALALSLLRYKNMLKFPSAFIVYQTTSGVLLLTFTLIGRFNTQLYCSSDSLIESYRNGSPYCTFTGTAFSYIFMQLALWWIFYVASLFWGLAFPFHYRSIDSSGKVKYIHLLAVVVGLLLPCINVGVSHGTGGYNWEGVPPLLCLPVNGVVGFYTSLVPITALTVAGLTLMVLVLWILIKQRLMQKHNIQGRVGAKRKVAVILAYFMLIGVYGAIALSITNRLWPVERLGQELTTYFLCERTGLGTCDRSGINDYRTPQTFLKVTYILVAILPIINIVYAWNSHDLKHIWTNSTIARYLPYYDKRYTLDALKISKANSVTLEKVCDHSSVTNTTTFTSYISESGLTYPPT